MMRIIFRLLHALLVLTLTILLVWSVYYAFSLLSYDPQQPRVPSIPEVDESERIPNAQEIAKSMNTHWMSFDAWHCKNVCQASYAMCQAKLCDTLPGMRRWKR